MPSFEELGAVELEMQQNIQKGFDECSSKLGRLVFRRQIDEDALTVWQEPGLIVALETRTDTEVVETLQFEDERLPQTILEAVADVTRLTVPLIQGPSRKANFVEARHISMYLMRQHTNLSYPKIAKIFGRRDHTTAVYAVHKVEDYIRSGSSIGKDNDTKAIIRQVERRLVDYYESKAFVSSKEVPVRLMDAATVTHEGLHLYPATTINIKHAKAMRLSSNEIMLDWDKRTVSDELIKTYGSTVLRLMSIEPRSSGSTPTA